MLKPNKRLKNIEVVNKIVYPPQLSKTLFAEMPLIISEFIISVE